VFQLFFSHPNLSSWKYKEKQWPAKKKKKNVSIREFFSFCLFTTRWRLEHISSSTTLLLPAPTHTAREKK
jgi:hypothetical protein